METSQRDAEYGVGKVFEKFLDKIFGSRLEKKFLYTVSSQNGREGEKSAFSNFDRPMRVVNVETDGWKFYHRRAVQFREF